MTEANDGRPVWDEERVQEMVGAGVLVGIAKAIEIFI